MPIRPWRFSGGTIMPNSAQNSMPNNSQSDSVVCEFPKLFEVIFAMVFDVLPWSKTWKSKVQPFCTHWLA
jgi:hypothetical protein